MKKYLYAVLPMQAVVALTVPLKGSPNTREAEKEIEIAKSFRNLLACGYRWIRTDGIWAVFEREEGSPPALRPGGALWVITNRAGTKYSVARRRFTVRALSAEHARKAIEQREGKGEWYAQPCDGLPPGVEPDLDLTV